MKMCKQASILLSKWNIHQAS